ncbi:MAG: caspase family protein [Cyanomargarita calcarea GSE-NOS-MK-12-04C]|jgi:WD40 repeat protein/energy-coupling factor transporter ATP-binding protein EcfA2|uniref:Caspase family protein n=1 Tax=Cyanomargarita calcarea GSE-NOS-MK-12-04C TaxID=2839659 RepID=A0A951QQX7_9CYAN|nr:caspase family protein [Cyanomargarita calcarea GSE-NOS-MK-12-04C]
MARYALVIGNTEYQSPSLPRLSKTTNDAEAVARLLEEYGDFQSVKRLPQRWNKEKNGYEMGTQKVTAAQLGQELRTFLLEQATNNEALIYFSGHGFAISDNLGQEKGYLATADTQIEVEGNDIVEQKYGIPLDSLNELIRDSKLSSLVMLLDCCHSGYFLERHLVERTLTAFSSQKDYYLITACRGFERAGAIKSDEYSIFTGAVLQGLAAENAGNHRRISGDRLFDFVSGELQGSVQEPLRMGWGRSITLVTYPQSQIPIIEESVSFNSENPYRGLDAFETAQAEYFGGRSEAVRSLISRLVDSKFLAVIGYSGSGKSSLVKAGLLPQLKCDRLPGSSQWEIVSFTPGEHPLGKLVEILTRQQENKASVLFIDQFEELFTLCEDDDERKAFIRLATEQLNNPEHQTRIIVTVRGDFLQRCTEYREIINLINRTPPTTYMVSPMSLIELEEAIEKPAKLHGVTFEHGLVSEIAQDVRGQPGALPLLQYALKELWRICIEEASAKEPLLTCKGYKKIGGVKGALDKRATILYHSLTPKDQVFARCLFMELVQLSETKEVTRRRASWGKLQAIADSPEQLQRVVGLLAGSQQRLIITDSKTVEVTHEALLSEWKLLNSWIAENRENIRLSRSLEEDCQEWEQRFHKSDDALLVGAKLAVISEWVERQQPRLTPQEAEFLRASLAKRDREIQAELEQERQLRELAEARSRAEIEKAIAAQDMARAEAAKYKYQRQRTKLAIAASTLVVFTLGLGLVTQNISAQEKQGKAIASGALISRPEILLETGNQLEAVIASVESLKQLQDIGAGNFAALNRLKNVIDSVQERNRIEGHKSSTNGISFSPKEDLIVSASSDKTLKMWKSDGTEVKTPAPMKHDHEVYTVNFSPNGEYFASASADKKVKLWQKDGTLITTLPGDEAEVYFVNFSPDSQTIISTSSNGTVKLWKIESFSPKVIIKSPTIIKVNNKKVWSAEFSPDGQLIATAGNEGIKIFKKDGTFITDFEGHTAAVRYVTFGQDSKSLISVGEDNQILIWKWQNDPKTSQMKLFSKVSDKSYVVKFSPDYRFIASSSTDGSINILNADNGEKVTTLKGHKNQIFDLSFRNDSKAITTVSKDETLRIWSLEPHLTNNSQMNTIDLLKKGCNWVGDYIRNNQKARNKYHDVNNICPKAN